jgi:carbonic anhydrase
LVEANHTYSENFPYAGIPGVPARQIAVVTCMDCRIDPLRALGLEVGEANILRNAGGLVTDDVIWSLATSQRKLGTTAVMVIQHSRCGLSTFSDEEFVAELTQETGQKPPWGPRPYATDQETNIRTALQAIRTSPYLPHRDDVRGFIFDVDTGQVNEIIPD